MDKLQRSQRWRKIRASWRDTLLLLRQFGWPLFFFILALVGGGLLYFFLSEFAGHPVSTHAETIYLMLSLTFLQPLGDFPNEWYLQTFYFLMPIIGISILAQGLADFGLLFFNRHARSKEWEMAVASTFNNHIVLIGLGHLGFRVMKHLHELNQDVVVIELNPNADLIAEAQTLGVPVIQDDGVRPEALAAAGIQKARAIVLCTQNDSMNLQIAFKARRLKPGIRVVARIFDDDFAWTLREQFGFQTMSATGMAGPTFAAAAAGVDITRPITVEGETFSLVRLDIGQSSQLIGRSMAEIEQKYDVSVVLLRHDGQSDFHPAGDRCLAVNDVLGVLAGPAQISRLVEANERVKG
ncbi:MAG: NAD-binding protein [Ardenticatenaceae bacterium]|nr:NAD-binding protein [Ardenticatenaceae bacterium]MCB9442612.1 NAD-binding protein [Ardenticatenaceae bacterium]